MALNMFAKVGGVFAVLVFWHFLADWVFQSHKEEMQKSNDRLVRAWHCLKYALVFVPLFWWASFPDGAFEWSMVILFASHYVIDSYVPVLLWAKFLRKAPQFDSVGKDLPAPVGWSDRVIESPRYRTNEEALKAFALTPRGLVLMITMDQFLHIAFLLPIAYLAVVR
jgi:hypothetical protein